MQDSDCDRACKNSKMIYAPSKDSDQPAELHIKNIHFGLKP